MHIGFRLKSLPVRPWYLCTTFMRASWSGIVFLPCITSLGALHLIKLAVVFFWRLSLLFVRDQSATAQSVLQVKWLNDVPSTEMSGPMAHLLL